jgi:CheY-like chemotaxis protein
MTRRVLIVDDSRLARMVAIRTLSELHPDWTILEAISADDALDKVGEFRLDLALIDINMPGRDGLVLAGELLALQPETAIVVISANAQTEIIARCDALGATFIAKPLKPQTLAAALAKACPASGET